MRTFTIELRVSHDTPERDELMRKAVRDAARNLFTVASMIQEKRKPAIAAHSNDYFEGEKEIMLDDSEDEDPLVEELTE